MKNSSQAFVSNLHFSNWQSLIGTLKIILFWAISESCNTNFAPTMVEFVEWIRLPHNNLALTCLSKQSGISFHHTIL